MSQQQFLSKQKGAGKAGRDGPFRGAPRVQLKHWGAGMAWEGCVKVGVRTLLSVHGRLAGIWSCFLMDSFANLGIFSLLGLSFLVLLFSGTFLACSSSLFLCISPLASVPIPFLLCLTHRSLPGGAHKRKDAFRLWWER